ncbi:MAG: hypothetical protein N3B12_05515 [Armatimonadetes bacterium]|nr:hypothetical protein [Armatimonadota bacterium]
MVRNRGVFIAAASMVVAMAFLGGVCHAAKAKSKPRAKVYVKPAPVFTGVRLTKIHVPAYILKGSLVTKGRVFYRSPIPENRLAGITLSRPASSILAKWGNPTRITVGSAQVETAAATAPKTPEGPAYIPSGGGLPNLITSFGQSGGYSPLPALGVGPQELPGLPGPTSTTGTQAQPATGGGESRVLRQEEVTWTYDLPNGITLEFIITDGIITQITVGGEGPWALSKTRTGLQLGDTYKLVLWVMGFPEEPQRYVGRFLRVSYIEKNRVLFTFLNKKLVGITVALVQQELREGAGQKP